MNHLKTFESFSDYTQDDYYALTVPEHIKNYSLEWTGKQVTWYGDKEQMIVIHRDDVNGMWGNVYEPNKMDFIAASCYRRYAKCDRDSGSSAFLQAGEFDIF